jgi:hypothetical protein
MLGRIGSALLPMVPFGLCSGPVVASIFGWETWFGVAVGGLVGAVVGVSVGMAEWLGFLDFLRRPAEAPASEPAATAKPATDLTSKVSSDLWVEMIFPSVFAGLILCIPLMATPVDGNPWGNIVLSLLVGAVLVIWSTVICPPRLQELARRGEWTPPGVATHPYRVAFVQTALIIAAAVAFLHAAVWVLQLCGV